MNAARLPEARLRFPKLAADEDAAMCRVRRAVGAGDIKAGSQALADWIDAQVAMLLYLDIDEKTDLTMQ